MSSKKAPVGVTKKIEIGPVCVHYPGAVLLLNDIQTEAHIHSQAGKRLLQLCGFLLCHAGVASLTSLPLLHSSKSVMRLMRRRSMASAVYVGAPFLPGNAEVYLHGLQPKLLEGFVVCVVTPYPRLLGSDERLPLHRHRGSQEQAL